MNSMDWLLETNSPGVRFLALRDLLGFPSDHPELTAARKEAHQSGPIALILDEMNPEGYWCEPGPGYYPKYYSTVWSLITLSQLGASIDLDQRIFHAGNHALDNSITSSGMFSISGTPSGTADCLQGNMCEALISLGIDDPRLDLAFEWMARSVTGEGVSPVSERAAPLRYYAGNCGPLFACGSNNKLSCAWGAAKVMLAFSRLPRRKYTPLIEQAIQQGVDFLFSVDPSTAAYPSGFAPKPSRNWWKFGFPVFYITDLLQIVEALVGLGYANDPRLRNALDLIHEKQDEARQWCLEYSYTGKVWLDFGKKKLPNKWVTLRALRVLKNA